MKDSARHDERIVMQNRKIASDTCYILMFTLFVSILVQQYSFNAPFSQYAVELIVLLVAFIHILIRKVLLGEAIFTARKTGFGTIATTSLVCGITVTAINGGLNYARYAERYSGNPAMFPITLAITFVAATAGAFLPLAIAHFFDKKRRRQIETKLDEDENKIA